MSEKNYQEELSTIQDLSKIAKETNCVIIMDENWMSKKNELTKRLKEHKGIVVSAGQSFAALGVSAKTAQAAFKAMASMDFSQLESRVIMDSISEPEVLGPWIDETSSISKKEWKKLSKKMKKQLNIEPQTQAEIWGNKWNKKLKKKL